MIKVHPKALVHENAIVEEGATIGARSRVWAFVHILPGAVIGDDCNVCDHVFIENDVRVGNRVTLKCGVFLWDGIYLDDVENVKLRYFAHSFQISPTVIL